MVKGHDDGKGGQKHVSTINLENITLKEPHRQAYSKSDIQSTSSVIVLLAMSLAASVEGWKIAVLKRTMSQALL